MIGGFGGVVSAADALEEFEDEDDEEDGVPDDVDLGGGAPTPANGRDAEVFVLLNAGLTIGRGAGTYGYDVTLYS